MKNLFIILTITLSALILTPKEANASTPQKVVFDNNTSWTIYVYIYARDPATSLIYKSRITPIPGGVATYFNMHPGGIYTPVGWPVGGVPPAGSEFYGIEYFEYDPTNSLCFPGGATPGTGCGFISDSMNIVSPTSACMETSGSTCAPMPANTVINGSVTATYWRSMDVSFN